MGAVIYKVVEEYQGVWKRHADQIVAKCSPSRFQNLRTPNDAESFTDEKETSTENVLSENASQTMNPSAKSTLSENPTQTDEPSRIPDVPEQTLLKQSGEPAK